jgi:hypothetical protein
MIVNKIDFNKEWAKTVSKEEFIKTFIHVHFQDLSEVKRKLELEKAYDFITDKYDAKQSKGRTKKQSDE